jgi:hypothetical protein
VKRGRLNRIGVGRLALRAGTFKVYFRVEERDPLELGHGDPVLLAGNNYHPENFLKRRIVCGMRFASEEHPEITAFFTSNCSASRSCDPVPRSANASAIASMNSLTENLVHPFLQTEPTERPNAS